MAVMASAGKEKRARFVDELRQLIRESSGMVFMDCQRLDSVETFGLRKAVGPTRAKLKVVKNRLMRIACEQEHVSECSTWLKFNTAIAFVTEDPMPAVKVIARYATEHENLKLKGAFIEGRPLELEGLKTLAALPGRPELLTMVATQMKAPLVRAARSFGGMYVKLALLLKEAAKKAPQS